MSTIVISGYLIRFPVGGNVWAQLPYIVGLSRLGHDVWFVEDAGWEGSCYDPLSGKDLSDPSTGLAIVKPVLERFGLGDRVAFRDLEGNWHGPAADQAPSIFRDADLYLDVGGTGYFDEMMEARLRALIDMDPVFTQLSEFGHQRLSEFDHHFTYGLAIGSDLCRIPTGGISWIPLPPPELVDVWKARPSSEEPIPWTTVASWKTYADITFESETYGHKDVEFRRFIDLPSEVPVTLEVAFNGPDAPREEFARKGWRVRDAAEMNKDVSAYEDFVLGSRGEFSVAKNAYVKARSGWFSDRTASYLASGRPAVVQETGITSLLPVGEGLLTFTDVGSAARALKEVESDLPAHSEAAARFADTYLSTEVVLPRLLEVVGL